MFSYSKTILTLGAVAALATAVLPASVQAGEVQNRLNRQQQRINQGVRSGQLTQSEYNRDERHLEHIERNRNNDLRRNGGHLTAAEQARLNRRLNKNSNRVYYTKHNRADQPGV